ncbi:hypothetical protein ATZ35_06565 [Enterococcus rotai]|uniref:Uncharacterized protein n=1 Tax=Enterococcus rotai TaxID=118060 RepID=A0A0U2XHI2_9ENTE|nr:hypothetical protein ATZ35_06565 [Enterococcus rotai]
MVYQVNIIKERFKKYKLYFLNLLFIAMAWSLYFLFFNSFYKEAAFYIDKKAGIVIQLLFLTTYYLDAILVYIALAFILLTIHQLIIVYFFINEQKKLTVNKKVQPIIWLFLFLFIICLIGLMANLIWPLFLLTLVFSSTVVYIIYVATKYIYEDTQNLYENNENIKLEGPFKTKEEAQAYVSEFDCYWKDYFDKKGFSIHSNIELDDSNNYFVYLYTISKNN